VTPVTSNVASVFPFQVLVAAADSGLRADSRVQAEQVRAVSVDRIGRHIGTVPAALMLEVDEALRLHLAV
jgi:mRNA interferase MazF